MSLPADSTFSHPPPLTLIVASHFLREGRRGLKDRKDKQASFLVEKAVAVKSTTLIAVEEERRSHYPEEGKE